MVNLRQALWTLLLVCACISSVHAHRVAILSDPGQSDMEALLLSSLSSSPDIEFVERRQIDAIAREKRMEGFSADSSHLSELGKMLGADALVVLEDHGENLICKIIAVGPALIVDEQTFRSPVKDIPGWVKVTGPRILATIGRLPSQPASSHLLSVLGIRNTVRTPEAKQRESECAALIEHALSSLAGVFVLERARLKESDWEKQLSESASTPYWASAWIVDGSLSGSDGAWTLDMRLQQRTGRRAQTFRVQATDLNLLAQAVADAVAQYLRTTRSEQWSLKDEATLYQQEAEWAYQWTDYARADRAASASWALGNHSDSLSLLRAKNCIGQTSGEGLLSVNMMFSEEPPPGMLEKIVEGFSYIRHLSQPEEDARENYLRTMTEICKTATKALRSYYYLERPRSREEDDLLRQIRSEIRRHLPYIAAASKETASDLMRGGTDIYPLEYPADFAVLYGQFAPLWSDDPKSSAQALLEAYKYVGEFEPPLCDELRDIVTAQREEHMPLTVAWQVKDRSSVISEREALLETIAKNGPEGRVHAAALNLSRFLHTFISLLIRSIPVDRVVEAVHRLQDAVWDSREEIITGGVPAHTLAAVILYMSEGAEYDSYADALMLDNIAFRKKLLMFLMERKWAGPQEVYGALLSDVRFTPEERDKLTDALSEMAKQKGAPRYTSFYPEQIAAATTGAQPPKPPANKPEIPKKLPPSVIYEILSDINYQYADRCIAHGDSFFIRVSGRFLRKIVEIAPSTGVKNAYDIPEEADSCGSDAWDISGENIYFGQKEKLIQTSLKTTQSTSIPVAYFETDPGIIRVIDGKIYASLLRGGIVRIDPATGQSELLASARRRPGQTILDDGPDFEVQRITSLPNGPAFTIVQAHACHVTVWNESNHSFEKLTNSLPNGLGYNPEFMLKWLGSEGSILSAATHLEACFLVDPQRTGKFPRLTTWPPPMKINGDESFPSELITAASIGDTVYILFRGGMDRTLHLKVMNKDRNVSIPLDVPFGQRSPLNQISVSESGVLLTGRGSKDAVFFSRKDLDAYQR